jgi:hypothetical protein
MGMVRILPDFIWLKLTSSDGQFCNERFGPVKGE